MTIYGLLIALMLVMRLAPDSLLGRWLNIYCVARPLQLLGRMERHHLIFIVLLTGLLLGAGETVVALGAGDIFVLYALDLSLYIDGLLVAMALSSIARTRSGVSLLKTGAALQVWRLRRVFGRRRVRSAVRKARRDKGSNDDDPAPALRLAA